VPPTYQGTHQATVTGGPDGTTSSNAADVVWNDPTEIDKTLAVYDNKVTEGALRSTWATPSGTLPVRRSRSPTS